MPALPQVGLLTAVPVCVLFGIRVAVDIDWLQMVLGVEENGTGLVGSEELVQSGCVLCKVWGVLHRQLRPALPQLFLLGKPCPMLGVFPCS